MSKASCAVSAVVAAALCLASAAASADNLLGFYAGFGLGQSTVRSDNYGSYGNGYGCGYGCSYGGYNGDQHFAWKAIVGVRPISIVGAELEYMDFGHPSSDNNYYYNNSYYYGPDSHPTAIAAFGVAHIPLPVPFLDIYGKLGGARLHTNVNGFDGATCGNPYNCNGNAGSYTQGVWQTKFAYGAGVQSKIWGLSFGAEYERISSTYGDPDMLSARVTWTF